MNTTLTGENLMYLEVSYSYDIKCISFITQEIFTKKCRENPHYLIEYLKKHPSSKFEECVKFRKRHPDWCVVLDIDKKPMLGYLGKGGGDKCKKSFKHIKSKKSGRRGPVKNKRPRREPYSNFVNLIKDTVDNVHLVHNRGKPDCSIQRLSSHDGVVSDRNEKGRKTFVGKVGRLFNCMSRLETLVKNRISP